MARGRRRAAVEPAVVVADKGVGSADSDPGDVDDFIEERHRQIAQKHGLDDAGDDDAGSDLGIGATAAVMDLDVSVSSSDDEDGSTGGSEAAGDADDADTQWGARRRGWYGGDTHEYEIMEDDEREEALRDEEEEAVRLQAKALSTLDREDYLGSSADEDSQDGDGEGDEQRDTDAVVEKLPPGKASADTTAEVAPELPVLLADLRECVAELSAAKAASQGGRVISRKARIRFHIAASYATNISFYFTLRTDPDAAHIDVRSHPVIAEILRLRALRQTSLSYPKAEDCEMGVEDEEGGLRSARGSVPDVANLGVDISDASNEESTGNSEGKEKKSDESGKEFLAKLRKRKKRSKRVARQARETEEQPAVKDDDDFVRSIVGEVDNDDDGDSDMRDAIAHHKRRKLNQIVGKLERERQGRDSRKTTPVDMQAIRENPAPPRLQRNPVDAGDAEDESDAFAEERALKKKAKKEARLARKKDSETPHVYTFDDRVDGDNGELRRRANSQVVHNRGLTRYRPRDKKTPRTKNREAFSKAVKKRRSVVRDPVQAKPTSYGGEASGINMRVTKSSRLSDV